MRARAPRHGRQTRPTFPTAFRSIRAARISTKTLLKRGVGIRFNGIEKTNVEEYCVSEGWIRVAAGRSRDRYGNPMTIKLKGKVEPYIEAHGQATVSPDGRRRPKDRLGARRGAGRRPSSLPSRRRAPGQRPKPAPGDSGDARADQCARAPLLRPATFSPDQRSGNLAQHDHSFPHKCFGTSNAATGCPQFREPELVNFRQVLGGNLPTRPL